MGDKIDIIIPCYNPSGEWTQNLLQSYEDLKIKSEDIFSFILVNDGSKAGITNQNIEWLKSKIDRFNYLSYDKNRGKGYAVRYGMKHSKSDIAIFTDIDFPYGVDSIVQMISSIKGGSDLVLALRDNSYYNNISTSRRIISKFLKFSIKSFFRIPYSDTQGGLKALSKEGKNRLLNTTIDRYLFDLELVKACSKNELKIDGIACELKPEIELTSVGFSILKNEFSNFIKIWRL